MAEKDKTSSTRIYHVLQRVVIPPEGTSYLEEVAEIEASSPRQAVDLVATERGSGRYIAVPDGNWTELRPIVTPQPPRITYDTEPTAAVEDTEVGAAENVEHLDTEFEDENPDQIPLVEDPEYQEKKAALTERIKS